LRCSSTSCDYRKALSRVCERCPSTQAVHVLPLECHSWCRQPRQQPRQRPQQQPRFKQALGWDLRTAWRHPLCSRSDLWWRQEQRRHRRHRRLQRQLTLQLLLLLRRRRRRRRRHQWALPTAAARRMSSFGALSCSRATPMYTQQRQDAARACAAAVCTTARSFLLHLTVRPFRCPPLTV
jgi:hypothetical protein